MPELVLHQPQVELLKVGRLQIQFRFLKQLVLLVKSFQNGLTLVQQLGQIGLEKLQLLQQNLRVELVLDVDLGLEEQQMRVERKHLGNRLLRRRVIHLQKLGEFQDFEDLQAVLGRFGYFSSRKLLIDEQ